VVQLDVMQGLCEFQPGNRGLYLPDTKEYRAADLDGDGLICGLGFTGGLALPVPTPNDREVKGTPGLEGGRWE